MTRPSRILVLADDLTGAAEIAGITIDHGIPTHLCTAECPNAGAIPCGAGVPLGMSDGCLVIDTDTRSLDSQSAANKIISILNSFQIPPSTLLYKKTDSLLRGPVTAELIAVMQSLDLSRTILLPQNPSKSRTIINGEYLISNTPLHQTHFQHDPEHPRKTSSILQLLQKSESIPTVCANPGDPLPDRGIVVACASTLAEVDHWAQHPNSATLIAGGADFFRALLSRHNFSQKPKVPRKPADAATFIICGSAAASSRDLVARWQAEGLPVVPMPEEVFTQQHNSSAISHWASLASHALQNRRLAIVAITHPVAPARAAQLRERTSEMVDLVLQSLPTQHVSLFVEGGATAAAITHLLAWSSFSVEGNLAPGVVTLIPSARPHIHLTIKPGSYAWPSNLLESA
jgi:uncharacterized protein YgbK (DUF1537 family)